MTQEKPFFVTGMPRSRTAWLANWLTTDTTFCQHDPPGNMLPNIPGRRVGLSGPEVCALFHSAKSQYPDAPWVVVIRHDAYEPFCRVMQDHIQVTDDLLRKWWATRLELLAEVAGFHRSLTVKFEELSNPEHAQRLWEHCLPEKPFDLARFELLDDLQITQDIWKRKETWP